MFLFTIFFDHDCLQCKKYKFAMIRSHHWSKMTKDSPTVSNVIKSNRLGRIRYNWLLTATEFFIACSLIQIITVPNLIPELLHNIIELLITSISILKEKLYVTDFLCFRKAVFRPSEELWPKSGFVKNCVWIAMLFVCFFSVNSFRLCAKPSTVLWVWRAISVFTLWKHFSCLFWPSILFQL